MTLLDLMNEKSEQVISYKTNINFIDTPLDNIGIELGQLITITGEQEAGKTVLLNMILSGLAKKEKCLYFSLEFNKRQLKKHFKKLVKDKTITPKALENIKVITNDMFSGDMHELITILNKEENKSYSIIGIDSILMLFIQELKGEQETTEIFRLLHSQCVKKDKTIFLIAQGSKEDNKDNRVSIFGSQKANHLIHIMLHLTFDRRKDKRELEFAKNKQNGYHGIIEMIFNKQILTLEQKKVIIKTKVRKQSRTISNLNITIEEPDVLSDEKIEKNKNLENALTKKGIEFE